MMPFSHLGKGKWFGEYALQKDGDKKSRQATVVCMSDCSLATLRLKDYQEIISIADKRVQDAKINFLKSVHFLSKLTKSQLKKILMGLNFREFTRHSVVCKQGDPAACAYIVN